MKTSMPLAFGDGEYIVALPIKQIVALEAKAGPIDGVRHRLIGGGWSINDITETIRHGLIGGGKGMVNGVEVSVSELKANHLIETYVEGCPLADVMIKAQAIIMTLYVGYAPAADEAQKKSPKERASRKQSTGEHSSTTV